MRVDLLERSQQALAGFAVEALDAKAELLDSFDQIVALGGERGVLGLDLFEFFFGAQIDRAEPFALAAQTLERRFDLGEFRQRLAFLELGEFGDARRLDLEHVVDFAADVGEAALGGFVTFFGAGEILAGRRSGLERGAGVAVGFAKLVLGFLQAIGAGAAVGVGGFDFGQQRRTLLGELRRGVFQFGAVAGGFADALFESRNLVLRAGLALQPAGLFVAERVEAAVGHLGLAHDGLLLGADFSGLGALAGDVVAHAGELGFQIGHRRQRGQPGFSFGLGGGGFVAAGGQARARFGQSRHARRVAVQLALGGFLAVARGGSFALAFARRGAGLGFGGDGRLQRGFGGGNDATGGFGFGTGDLLLGFDVGEAGAFGETSRGAGRRMGVGGKAVPAPQVAFGRDQTLAGLELTDETRAVGFVDDADLVETAGEFGRRLNVTRQRLDAGRQCRIAGVDSRAQPAHRRGGVDRRVEIVAQRCAQRLLVALVDRDVIHDRRPQILGFDGEHLRQGLGFGFQPLHAALGFRQWRARGVELLARRGVRGFRSDSGGFGFGDG